MSEDKIGNRGLLLNMTVEVLGSPGIMVNEDIAARTPCRCYTYEGEPAICYSRGIIGSMSKGQIEAYCKPLIEIGESKRVREFKAAAAEAKKEIEGIPKGERLEPWLKAMSTSLKKRGIEI
ncbi:unnamed protein product [marine sediment metagenome]|uniref:Uncharacterized protein n=1 Tax=marine sediment metagenome TaxID=412755 RepID=X1GEQ9_9ZZZZ